MEYYVIFSPSSKPTGITLGQSCVLPRSFPDMVVVFALTSKPWKRDLRLQVVLVNLKKRSDHLNIGTMHQSERAISWQPCYSKGFKVPKGTHNYHLYIGTDAELKKFLETPEEAGYQLSSVIKNQEETIENSQTESQELMMGDSLPEADRLLMTSTASPSPKTQGKAGIEEITPQLQIQTTPSTPPHLSHSASKKRKASLGEGNTSTPPSRKRQSIRQKSSVASPLSSKSENSRGQQTRTTAAQQASSTKRDSKDSGPSARWGHTLCSIGSKKSLLIGGQGRGQVISRDTIWMLDTENGEWSSPPTMEGSTKLPPRMGHTATFDAQAKCVYVYGGSKNLRWFSDMHVLDLETWNWSHVEASGIAPTRAYHSSNIFRNELYIFGGVYPNPDPQPDGCSNDVIIYSPDSESWYQPVTMGMKPKPRSGHSATLLGDKLVIFGGWDAPFCFNDLHILDLCLMEFTAPKVTGTPPSPRSWHASMALPGNRVLIHGGYNGNDALADAFIFHLDTYTWTPAELHSDTPIGIRAGHTIISMHGNQQVKDGKENTSHSTTMAIFGGGDNEGNFFADLIPFRMVSQDA
ncbi:kelch domain-containing protein 2-like [Diadema setosum]|uniref:kelch domain-containing protein 2-like n=1 Tax=Diadema setosum TaxID=31175 RepID=UPI003B3A9914